MDSIGEECKELKKKYDECFNEWFGEYLKGRKSDPCKTLLKDYQCCVNKVLKEKGIDVDEAYRKVVGTKGEMTSPDSKKSSKT